LAVLVLSLGPVACGESDEEKAQNTVCDAKEDLAQQVDELAGLTPATVTTDSVNESLEAIRGDLNDIGDAQSELSEERRSQVEAATREFTTSLATIAGDLGSSLSASDAKAELTDALKQVETSYREAFAQVECD
jgi:hypothetical protein